MLKPYNISIDWLSLSFNRTLFFRPSEQEIYGNYVLSDVGHGAKFWRSLRRVTTKDKREIGICCFDNTLAENAHLVVMKYDNALLYDTDCFEVIIDCALALGLEYRGVSRIDLACDFNSFKQNLSPQKLINGYLCNKYLKAGVSRYMINAHHNYFATGRDVAQLYDKRPILDPSNREAYAAEIARRNAELLEHGMPLIPAAPPKVLLDVKPHTLTSITWGSRSSGVQVQLYNKTLEMQEVHPKWHIVKTWQEAGLDTSRDVWRLEIRITTRGRELVNDVTGQPFKLNVVDILIQEQVEQLFFAYLDKYFKWYRNDGHRKLQNCKRLSLFDVNFVPITKPMQYSREAKSYNRTSKLIARNLEVHRIEQEAQGNTYLAHLLQLVSEYYTRMYKLGDWLQAEDVRTQMETGKIRSLEPSVVPLDDRYYSAEGLRALAMARLANIAYTLNIDLDKPLEVDWKALEQGERNVRAIFFPAEAVPVVHKPELPKQTIKQLIDYYNL